LAEEKPEFVENPGFGHYLLFLPYFGLKTQIFRHAHKTKEW
jgi:hypothetical protein